MTRPRPQRQRFDPLTRPASSPEQIACDHAIAGFDRAAGLADRTWGVDRLPALVPADMAAKYGSALATLNGAIEADDPNLTATWAGVCTRGLEAMDAAARAAGHQPVDPEFWECEHEGFHFAVIRDDAEWPALKEKRPELLFFSMTEVAIALKAHRMATVHFAEMRKAIPEARVTAIRLTPPLEPVDWDNGGDDLGF